MGISAAGDVPGKGVTVTGEAMASVRAGAVLAPVPSGGGTCRWACGAAADWLVSCAGQGGSGVLEHAASTRARSAAAPLRQAGALMRRAVAALGHVVLWVRNLCVIMVGRVKCADVSRHSSDAGQGRQRARPQMQTSPAWAELVSAV